MLLLPLRPAQQLEGVGCRLATARAQVQGDVASAVRALLTESSGYGLPPLVLGADAAAAAAKKSKEKDAAAAAAPPSVVKVDKAADKPKGGKGKR